MLVIGIFLDQAHKIHGISTGSFTNINQPFHVGKYTSPMDGMGPNFHCRYICLCPGIGTHTLVFVSLKHPFENICQVSFQ